MTQHAVQPDHLTEAEQAMAEGDPVKAAAEAGAGLRQSGEDRALMIVLLRAQIAGGDLRRAGETAARLRALPPDGEVMDALIEAALADRNLPQARNDLAATEAAGAAPAWALARAKARIALADGDHEAATAILVMAIEREPDIAPLRTLLTEALLASGGGAHARAVQTHLGKAPVIPPDPAEDAAQVQSEDRARG